MWKWPRVSAEDISVIRGRLVVVLDVHVGELNYADDISLKKILNILDDDIRDDQMSYSWPVFGQNQGHRMHAFVLDDKTASENVSYIKRFATGWPETPGYIVICVVHYAKI